MGSQRVGHDWATELNWSLENCSGKEGWGSSLLSPPWSHPPHWMSVASSAPTQPLTRQGKLGGLYRLEWWLSGLLTSWSPFPCLHTPQAPQSTKWQPTLVFLPGESQGQRRLAGYSPGGCKELATTEWLSLYFWWCALSNLGAPVPRGSPTRKPLFVTHLQLLFLKSQPTCTLPLESLSSRSSFWACPCQGDLAGDFLCPMLEV